MFSLMLFHSNTLAMRSRHPRPTGWSAIRRFGTQRFLPLKKKKTCRTVYLFITDKSERFSYFKIVIFRAYLCRIMNPSLMDAPSHKRTNREPNRNVLPFVEADQNHAAWAFRWDFSEWKKEYNITTVCCSLLYSR